MGKKRSRANASSSADLIVTDIVMPDIEGIEMIMKRRKSAPKIKIVAMSGWDYLTLAKQLGADLYAQNLSLIRPSWTP